MEDFVNHEYFDSAIALNEADFLTHGKLEKQFTGKVIMSQQAHIPVLGRHAKLGDLTLTR